MIAEEHEDDFIPAVRNTVEKMLSALDSRERDILRQRFGLDGGGEPATLEQIGQKFGVSKERIRQLEARAIAKLRTDFDIDAQSLLGA
jgi:RNA polymerase sigma factor (sigma-70 family)